MHAPSQPFDAITAFAVPNPNCSSQSRRFLQVWLLNRLPRRVDHSVYFGLAKVYFSQPFRLSTGSNPKQFPHRCQCRFLVQSPNSSKHASENATHCSVAYGRWRSHLLIFHSMFHSTPENRTTSRANREKLLTQKQPFPNQAAALGLILMTRHAG